MAASGAFVVNGPAGDGRRFVALFDESEDEGAALPDAFQAVYPTAWRLPSRAARPYVYVNFVLSRDGRVSYDDPGHLSGADVSGFDPFDAWLMGLLRARADAILMGDVTLRVEPDHVWSAEHICPVDAEAFASLRRAEGRAPLPLQVFLSLEGDLDCAAAGIFSLAGAHVVVATTGRGAPRAEAAASDSAARVDVLELGEQSVDVPRLLSVLEDEYGVTTLLCEGGPRTYGSLLRVGCVDDEFLALAPTVLGSSGDRPRPGLVEGVRFSPSSSPSSRPLALHRAGDLLFLRSRYAFPSFRREQGVDGASISDGYDVVASRRRSRRGSAVSGLEVRTGGIHELVERGSAVRWLAGGFGFVEGPIWHPGERRLLFSDLGEDVRRAVTLDGVVTELRRPSFKCNGMTLDADHNLLVCEHVSSSLVRERPDGTRVTLAFHFEGRYLNSPNDVTVRSDGTVYFTDPWYGRMPAHGVERARELGWQGVFRIPPGGGQDELALSAAKDEFEMPNGLCLSPDESLLYVDDTVRGCIRVFDVQADGTLADGRVFRDGIGSGDPADGVVDGMRCDERGNVWVTGPGGIWVLSPGGEHLGTVRVPEVAANLSWGGPDWHTLFVAASTSIYAIRTLVGPRREPYMR